MEIVVVQYTKVKRRNALRKVYHEWILVWDSETKRKIQELNGSDKE